MTDGWGSVYAIDVTTGKRGVIRWKFDRRRRLGRRVACCGVNNRGVALWKDKVISIALDGRMFALNKATGEMVWERKVADPAISKPSHWLRWSFALPSSGLGRRIRHPRMDRQHRPQHRQQVWRATIPGANEPGNDTWKDGKER